MRVIAYRSRPGFIEFRCESPVDAKAFANLLQRHGHTITFDRNSDQILFLKNPQTFVTADALPRTQQQKLEVDPS